MAQNGRQPMGPAQTACCGALVNPQGAGPAKSQGSPGYPTPDDGPIIGAASKRLEAYGYPPTHPLGGAPGRYESYGRLRARSVAGMEPGQIGLGGAWSGAGQYVPAEPTARVALSGVTGTANGNPFAFLPPPDKFLVLNIRKTHNPLRLGKNGNVTRAYIGPQNWTQLGKTSAPVGNG